MIDNREVKTTTHQHVPVFNSGLQFALHTPEVELGLTGLALHFIPGVGFRLESRLQFIDLLLEPVLLLFYQILHALLCL